MAESLKHKAVNSVLWRIGEQGANQVIQLVISIILARLIMPEQFGMIGMLVVFTAVSNVFINSGFSSALIRKPHLTQADCSTVYLYNIGVSLICYLILFCIAPWVSDFYGMVPLCPLLRVLSLNLIIGSFAGVHRTLLTKEMDFKSMTKYNILGLAVSGVVGICMAFLGFEVWALVAQSLTGTAIGTICVCRKVKWRPTLTFSRESFREFFGFGSRMLASELLNTIYTNIYSIVIGKVYRASDLAYYNRGNVIMQMTSSTPTGILQSVTYPTLCKLQDNDDALCNGYRRMLRLSAFIVFPLSLGAGAVAYPFISVLFTERWIFSATLMSIMAFGAMWYPIHAINLNYLMVKGRSDLFFRLEIIKKVQGVIMLCITVPFGIEAMCWGSVVTSIFCLFYNTYYNGKFLNLSIWRQLGDFLPTLCLCAVMYAGARTTAHALGNGMLSLACSVSVGAIIYIGGALLFRFPEVAELKNIRK